MEEGDLCFGAGVASVMAVHHYRSISHACYTVVADITACVQLSFGFVLLEDTAVSVSALGKTVKPGYTATYDTYILQNSQLPRARSIPKIIYNRDDVREDNVY